MFPDVNVIVCSGRQGCKNERRYKTSVVAVKMPPPGKPISIAEVINAECIDIFALLENEFGLKPEYICPECTAAMKERIRSF